MKYLVVLTPPYFPGTQSRPKQHLLRLCIYMVTFTIDFFDRRLTQFKRAKIERTVNRPQPAKLIKEQRIILVNTCAPKMYVAGEKY